MKTDRIVYKKKMQRPPLISSIKDPREGTEFVERWCNFENLRNEWENRFNLRKKFAKYQIDVDMKWSIENEHHWPDLFRHPSLLQIKSTDLKMLEKLRNIVCCAYEIQSTILPKREQVDLSSDKDRRRWVRHFCSAHLKYQTYKKIYLYVLTYLKYLYEASNGTIDWSRVRLSRVIKVAWEHLSRGKGKFGRFEKKYNKTKYVELYFVNITFHSQYYCRIFNGDIAYVNRREDVYKKSCRWINAYMNDQL